jgi:hypothetical protein
MKAAARGDAMKTTIALLAAIAFLVLPISGRAQTSTVPWCVTDMGFEVSSSSTIIMKSLVGQEFVGTLQGANSIIESGFLTDTLFRTVVTSVAERGRIPGTPKEYALQQNYPNPFNPSTTIKFELPKASQVSLTVYDVLGREVSMLVNDIREAGVHEVRFDASRFSSGVYLYRIQAGDFVTTRKMLLMK